MIIEYYIIKPEDEFCNSVDTFKSLLLSNTKFTINENTITCEDVTASYTLTTDLINNETERLFILHLKHEDKDLGNSADALLKIIKYLQITLVRSDKKFKIIPTNNELEQYLLIRAYPIINALESEIKELTYKHLINKEN